MTDFVVRPLDGSVDSGDFACGTAVLDEYLRRYASQDVRRKVARVFVATPADDARCLAGYFTLNAGSVGSTELPHELARKLPRYPIPVAMIGRLAVSQAFQGRGLGSILIADACRKIAEASHVLAMAGVIVDAKDANAEAFYRHFGFVPLPGRADRLFLAMQSVEGLL